jgi:sRNA-binding regulator protein Hfq
MLGFNISQQITFRRDTIMTRLLAELIDANKGKKITLFLTNSFQLHGTLLDSDEAHIKLRSNDYCPSKDILVSHSAISTIVPGYRK